MTRVLVTGGAGTIGSAVVRRLLRDPGWEVRVSDQREPPAWMQGEVEVHSADLRIPANASDAVTSCSHVIHLAAIVGGIANFHKLPYTLTEANNALTAAVVHAAIDQQVQRAAQILGLTPYLNRYPRQLSGGQRQRVAMGRAIVRDSAVG